MAAPPKRYELISSLMLGSDSATTLSTRKAWSMTSGPDSQGEAGPRIVTNRRTNSIARKDCDFETSDISE